MIKYSVFYTYLFFCIILCIILVVFFVFVTGIIYAVIRQISMLFIGNKDSVFCTWQKSIKQRELT